MDETRKKFHWKNILDIVMAVLLVACFAKIHELENQIANFNNTIVNGNHLISNMQHNIDSIYDNVEKQLKKEASLLSSIDYTLGELNTNDHTVPVTMNLTPKTLTDDVKIAVNVDGQRVTFERNGNEFSATFSVGMFIEYDNFPMLNIVTDDTTKTELLENVSLTALYDRYLPMVYAYITPFDEFKNGKLSIDGHLQFAEKPTAIDSEVSVRKIELVTEKTSAMILWR